MTAPMSPQQASVLAADPATSAEQLAHLAAQHRELWPQIAAHPNAYEALVDWMRQQGFDPSAAAQPHPASFPQVFQRQPQQSAYPAQATTQQTYAYTEQPVPGRPMQVGAPGFQGFPGAQPFGGPAASPGKKKTGWVIGGIAGVLVVALIAVLTVFVFIPRGGSGSLEAQLAALEAEDEFRLQIIDIGNLERVVGEKFPKNGTDDEAEAWFDEVIDDDRIEITLPPTSPLSILAAETGVALNFMSDSWVGVLPDSVSEKRIDELFDREADGVWSHAGMWLAQVDGTLYFSDDEDAIPSKKPDRADSLAADSELKQVIQRLQRADVYSYSVARLDSDYTGYLFGDEDAAEVSTVGSALSANDEGVVSTRVFAHESSDDAKDNLELIGDFFTEITDDTDIEFEVKQEGALVVVTTSAKDLDELDSYLH